MDTINAMESKEKRPQRLDELYQAGEALSITKNQKLVFGLQPDHLSLATIYGLDNGKVVSKDDLAPSNLNWDAA